MLNPEQKQLVTSTLRSIIDMAILPTLWQMPFWARIAIGATAFGVLVWVLR